MTSRARLLALPLLAGALVLTACLGRPGGTVTVLPTDGPGAAATPTATATAVPQPTATVVPGPVVPAPDETAGSGAPDDGALDCGGRPTELGGNAQGFVLRGDCPDVLVQGNEVEVDATGATIGVLRIEGSRVTVAAASATEVSLAGTDLAVALGDGGTVDIAGDRNVLAATGSWGAVTVTGNDNVVSGTVSGPVSDNGQRNRIG